MFNKWLKRLKKNERGLTLVELLAVIVILAIVAAIAFVLISNVVENSRKDAHISNAMQLISAAKLYDTTEGGTWESGSKRTLEQLKEAGYLGDIHDPWKGANENYGEGAEVEKTVEGGVIKYSVTFPAGNCNITASEKKLNTEDRDAICGAEVNP